MDTRSDNFSLLVCLSGNDKKLTFSNITSCLDFFFPTRSLFICVLQVSRWIDPERRSIRGGIVSFVH